MTRAKQYRKRSHKESRRTPEGESKGKKPRRYLETGKVKEAVLAIQKSEVGATKKGRGGPNSSEL